ncbi:hypothetical protein XIS1_1560034 [Xenorhabdus innexi]|uniref:Uncharacterized protein n=1 Tax=Xenorhabdus innexi TaxID=290109 RepID=A0A1N6MUS7_9GAMM|nr:hypothetical protein XIS1_1560034 [Xenorhabdus innexi]
MLSLPYNLFLARKAINYVNNEIGITSPNQLPTQTKGLSKLRLREKCSIYRRTNITIPSWACNSTETLL